MGMLWAPEHPNKHTLTHKHTRLMNSFVAENMIIVNEVI